MTLPPNDFHFLSLISLKVPVLGARVTWFVSKESGTTVGNRFIRCRVHCTFLFLSFLVWLFFEGKKASRKGSSLFHKLTLTQKIYTATQAVPHGYY